MKQVGELIQAPSGASGKPTATSSITDEHIAHLWQFMVMFFGYRWVNSYGDCDNGTWLAGLCDVTTEQILVGIDTVRLSGKEWPPTLPEFRKMCKPVIPPYHAPYQRLEQKRDWIKIQNNWHKLAELCREKLHAGK